MAILKRAVIILALLIPSLAYGYTYQDVENAYNSYKTQYPNDYIFIEEFNQDGQKGYRLWRRTVPDAVATRKIFSYSDNWVVDWYPGQWHWVLTCTGTFPYEEMVEETTRTSYYWHGGNIIEDTKCDGSTVIYSAYWYGGAARTTYCFQRVFNYDDCKANDILLATFFPIDECEVSVNMSPSEVWPQGAGSSATVSTLSVSLTKSAPPEGCTIKFTVEPVENSGGHSHTGGRTKGTVSPDSIPFASNEGWGPKTAEYNSSEVSGEEKIKAELKGNIVSDATIKVRVSGLGALAEGEYWRLTGSSGTTTVDKCSGKQITHSGNHYMTLATGYRIARIAQSYYKETNTILGINDASLIWGGLFDVCGDWGKPHTSHKEGKSVDIDRKVQDTETWEYVDVDRKLLDKIAAYYGGVKVKEPTIHYEF